MINIKYIFIILFLCYAFPHYSVKDQKIYDNISKKYYSHDAFIDSLVGNHHFREDKHFKKYRRSNDRLKFRNSWLAYLASVAAFSNGIDGMQNPEKWEEGGENYNGPNTQPPGIENIFLAGCIYTAFIARHKIIKDRSLYHVLNKYNKLYSSLGIKYEKMPHSYIDELKNMKRWYEFSIGTSERVPFGFLNWSLVYSINKKSEIYGTFSSLIFGGALGLGYKHFIINKNKFSTYVTGSFSGIFGGDSMQTINGINIAPGISFKGSTININLGISCFLSNKGVLPIPTINLSRTLQSPSK